MFASVTVGLDGTRESVAAAEWAAHEALTRDVPLQLVLVRDTGPYPCPPVVVADQTEREWSQRVTCEVAEDLGNRFPELSLTVMMLSGRPSYVLSDISARTGLLVLGSRGLGSVLGYLVGSTALATVAHATCPVVLVRPAAEPETPRTSQTGAAARTAANGQGHVVLGLDLGRPCEELLDFAFRTASRHSAPLRVLHAWQLPPAFGATPSYPVGVEITEDLQRETNQRLTETVRPWHEKFPDVPLSHLAVLGQPSSLLIEAAAGASMLVVGRRARHSRTGTHVGPVDHAVMHHVRTPIAVVAHE
ncbi:universal stress protein [Streptomyces ovatisporus]|uniref:Universal stress protein n=1 Tax=Streptomyces ovatisporus TaxID=1128682 RepID=A0ABV9A8Q0_9ACTN